MGIISDTYEDSTERYCQFLSEATPSSPIADSGNTPPIQRELPCPACQAPFRSRESLNFHILGSHAREHVYLLADGCVIRDASSVPGALGRVEVVLLGVRSAHVRIRLASEQLTTFTAPDEGVSFQIPHEFQGECVVDVRPVDRPRKRFVLFVRTLPRFSGEELDRGLSEIHEQLDMTSARPDLTLWRERLGSHANKLEQDYVDGFFEYSLGLFLENNGETAASKQRFEYALGRLLPFRTGLATTALRALGTKLNSFALLRGVPAHSRFAAANAFFGEARKEFTQQDHPAGVRQAVVVDEFTLHCLDAAGAYYKRDYSAFLRLLGMMEMHSRKDDRNNADKLALMTARYEAGHGDKGRARAAYDYLLHHPDFGGEAKRYSNEH